MWSTAQIQLFIGNKDINHIAQYSQCDAYNIFIPLQVTLHFKVTWMALISRHDICHARYFWEVKKLKKITTQGAWTNIIKISMEIFDIHGLPGFNEIDEQQVWK